MNAELAELDIGDFKMVSEPRRKRKAVYHGSYEAPIELERLPNPATPRKTKIAIPTKKKTPVQLPTPISPASPPFSLPTDNAFSFRAICTYKSNGCYDMFYESEDLKAMTELWDRIEVISTSIWEHNKGEDWRWEFERPGYKPEIPPCVTMKLMGKRTKWHAGFEGLYACKDCALAGRPCFAWITLSKGQKEADGKKWDHNEFRLLPLHEEDRVKTADKKNEIRYWINDSVKLVDPEEMDESWDSE
jgi:hypothetical protein